MMWVQALVHKLEMFSRAQKFLAVLLALAAALLALAYDLRNYRNMSVPEAMDSAQIARNLSEGKGFSTKFIRPFALFLLKRGRAGGLGAGKTNEVASAVLKGEVPDISNPPVYPAVLAGWMKVAPFNFKIPQEKLRTRSFWGDLGNFQRYEPDFLIALFNEILFLSVIALVFLWARKFFDSTVAWASAVLLLCTEVLWRFCVSGLSTIWLMLVFMLLVWSLTLLENEAREPKWGKSGLAILSVLTGVVLGVGAMSRYAFAWFIVPALGFIGFTTGQRRVVYCLSAAAGFAVMVAPWIVRNEALTGAPFGTCTYSLLEQTAQFPGAQLERSLNPGLYTAPGVLWEKVFENLHTIRQKNFFNLGSGWAVALFLTGLLIGFRSNTLRVMRYFLLLCLPLLVLVEAAGRTQLSVDSPEINSENLLVLLLPMILVYAAGFFFQLLDRLQLPQLEWRAVLVLFGMVACAPMFLALLKAEATPVAYPPYHPAVIQQVASWMKPDELTMSDIPWAVAWYGDRQSIWLTLDAVPDRENPLDAEHPLTVPSVFKPVNALYLTPQTIDSRLLSECLRGRDNGWGRFILRCLAFKEVPDNFPLHEMPNGFLPEQIFLSDSRRWRSENFAPDSSPAAVIQQLPENSGNDQSTGSRARSKAPAPPKTDQ